MSLEAPKHECGVVGIFSPNKSVSQDMYYGLIALQNRGQEGSGMAVFNAEGQVQLHKDIGLVNAVYRQDDIDRLNGNIGVGHVRYGVTGNPTRQNTHPFLENSNLGPFALVHNGNFFNAAEVKASLQADGEKFGSTTDSEVFARLIAISPGETYIDKIRQAASQLKGAFSYVLATPDTLIAGKDPYGIWPLSYAQRADGSYVVGSETNALLRMGGERFQDVENGEIVSIDREGIRKESIGKELERMCSFEFYYFSDPNSRLLGRSVFDSRFKMGQNLADEHPFDADWVIPIPETARPAAEGYSFRSKIPVVGALTRNRWLGRSFIEPSQELRELAAYLKYGPVEEIIQGSRVNLLDDSIVRGTTTRKLVGLMRDAGAREVNVLITAPPIIDICWLGVDTSDKKELIGARLNNINDIRDEIGADRLGFLSLQGGMRAIGENVSNRLCTACFTGDQPMEVPEKRDKYVLEGIR